MDINEYTPQNAINPERMAAIAALTFKDKMLIALKLTRQRGLAYGAILLVWFAGYMAACIFIGMFFAPLVVISKHFAFLLSLPVTYLAIMIMIGYSASFLRYMDGLEPKIRLATFFEPLNYWRKLTLPCMLLLITAIINNLASPDNGYAALLEQYTGSYENLDLPETSYAASSNGSSFSLPVYISSLVISFFLIFHYYYLAEHMDAGAKKGIIYPFKLLFANFGKWLSAGLGMLIAYAPMGLILLIFWHGFDFCGLHLETLYLYSSGPYANLGTPNIYFDNSGSPILFVLFSLITLAVGLVGCIYATFLYAIAYKQSMAASYLQNKRQ